MAKKQVEKEKNQDQQQTSEELGILLSKEFSVLIRAQANIQNITLELERRQKERNIDG